MLELSVADNEDEKTKRMLWMHKKQQKQLLSWENEDDDTAGRFGLRIIVLQNMFSLEESSSRLRCESSSRAWIQRRADGGCSNRLRGVWNDRQDHDFR